MNKSSKKTSINKWLKRVGIFILFSCVISYFYIDYELTQMYGGHTDQVNHQQFNTPQLPTAVLNANILSTDGTQMLSHQTVLIEQGIIVSVGEDIVIPKDSLVINAQGKYLIPGLIDSHVHLLESPNDLLLYLANGVTHIREMMGNKDHLKWRNEVNNGRIGPNIFVASSKLQSTNLFIGWFNRWTRKDININTLKKVNTILHTLKNQGFDAVKLGSMFDRDKYLAVNTASLSSDIPIIGHLTLSADLNDLWNGNQKELAHIEELVKALDREYGGYNSPNAKDFLSFVQQRSQDIANKMLKNKIAVVTTLNLMESLPKQKHQLNKILGEIQLSYVNPGLTEGTPMASKALGWLPEVNHYRLNDDYPSERLQGNKIYWQTYAKAIQILLKAMAQKGVKVLAGTDANNSVMVPGFSLHDELLSLTKSGMSNTQALLSATTVPANWMRQKSGIIKSGYKADLVLLNKNPLIDIENTKTIDTVIVNGKVLDHQKLDAMLDAVLKANNASRHVDISSF